MADKYRDKSVVVTGGARGLGRLIALDFAKEGADVAIVDVRADDLAATAKEIEALGRKALPLTVDLRRREACYQMIADVRARFGKVDVLVNNAGVVFNQEVVDMDDDKLELTMNVNFMAQMWATKAVLPEMIERKNGIIVSISSGAGKVGIPAMGVYCASKFALIGFFDSLRHELRRAKAGLKIVVVCPGYMDTKMFVGAKVPRFTSLFDPQLTSTALMKAIASGKEEIFIPWTLNAVAFTRGLYPPWLMEKTIEFTKMDESFYGSKTVD
jgi:all-trans-retinol dehydrogenase (NAD+)